MTDVVGKLATGPRRHFQKIQGSKLSVELRPWDGNRLYDCTVNSHKVTISMLVDRARAPLRNYPDKSDKSHRGRRASSRGTYKDRAAGTGLAPVRKEDSLGQPVIT